MLRLNLDQSTFNLVHGQLMRKSSSIDRVILDTFSSTSLRELTEMGLDNRVDSKFVLPKKILDDVLAYLSDHYSILSVDGGSVFTYENTYFDTVDRFFYRSHHNGKLNREKLRFRRYKESDLYVLETKLKTNKSRTIKQRIAISDNNQDDIVNFLNDYVHSMTGGLSPKLFNNYHRVTFTHHRKHEKVTLDFNLGFENPDTGQQHHIDDYFIVEVKTKDKIHSSEFSLYCKKNGIRENRFSKYCMGTCLTTNDDVKKNNFKKKLNPFR